MANSFLGTGWSFPPEFKDGSVSLTTDVEDIQRSLQILFSTRKGERVMLPDYGCDLDELVFEPINTTLKTYISELIRTAILYYEARIDLENILVDDSDAVNGRLLINLDYVVRTTNSRYNYVFPYFLNEASSNYYGNNVGE